MESPGNPGYNPAHWLQVVRILKKSNGQNMAYIVLVNCQNLVIIGWLLVPKLEGCFSCRNNTMRSSAGYHLIYLCRSIFIIQHKAYARTDQITHQVVDPNHCLSNSLGFQILKLFCIHLLLPIGL